jgi:two-component system response regulator DctR
MAVEAMRHGAVDFMQKPFSDKDLVDRIQRALSADRRNRETLGAKDQIRARIATLTPRERQVLELVTLGKSNKVMGRS